MSSRKSIRVIGSDLLFVNFLPDIESPLFSSEFDLIQPANACVEFPKIPSDGSLVVLVNPDDYEPELIELLPSPVCLWFLRRLALEADWSPLSSPNLSRIAAEQVHRRREHYLALGSSNVGSVVVSDRDSRELLHSYGAPVLLSPPPVSARPTTAPLLPLNRTSEEFRPVARSQYQSVFYDVVPSDMGPSFGALTSGLEILGDGTIALVIADSAARGFPYAGAVALSRGLALLSEALSPTWGLEPGIDYFEFSTPEELAAVIKYLERNPHALQLMRYRGQLKSRVFESSRVFARLIELISSPTYGR